MRALVVNTARLGDVVMMTPLLRALRVAGVRTTVVAAPVGAELLAGQDLAERIHRLRKRPRATGLVDLARLLARGERFDVAIAAHRSTRTALIARASRAPLRVGFDRARRSSLYSELVPWERGRHQVERYLRLLEPLGIGADEIRPRIAAGPSPLEPGYLCIAPGASRASKRWPTERYAELVAALTADGERVVVTGTEAERPLAAALSGAIDLCGRTDLATLASVLAGARLFVGNDSGTGHLAAAVGTPVVALFGPTAPQQGYTPYGAEHRAAQIELDCRPCHHTGPRRCPLAHHRCLRDLAVDDVLAIVRERLTGDLALAVGDHQGHAGVADDVDRRPQHVQRTIDGPDQRGVLGR